MTICTESRYVAKNVESIQNVQTEFHYFAYYFMIKINRYTAEVNFVVLLISINHSLHMLEFLKTANWQQHQK